MKNKSIHSTRYSQGTLAAQSPSIIYCIFDPGRYWWSPAYSTWGPTIFSFSFSVSAQLTIFSIFLAPELPEPFWGPKRRFFGYAFTKKLDHPIHPDSCSPRIELSNDVSCVSNGDGMPKLRPWEVETPIYPNEAHSFCASSPRVRFFDVYGSPLFLNNK